MPAASNKTMTGTEWAMLLALSALWGGSFFFTGIAVKELPPLTIVLLRVGLAALILNIVTRALGLRMPTDPRVWLAFVGMGFLNNAVPFGLIVWGQTQIASGLASILNATTPLFAVALAHLLTKDERLTGARMAGVIVGFGGVVLMIGPAALAGLGSAGLAQVAVLCAALSYALAGIYGRLFKRLGVDPIVTAAGQVTASALMLTPVALVADRPWALAAPGPATWLAILGIAALSTALAYMLYFRILATAGATNLLLVTFLIPVTAILLGWLVLDERLEPKHLAGMACIGAGLAAIDGRLLKLVSGRLFPSAQRLPADRSDPAQNQGREV